MKKSKKILIAVVVVVILAAIIVPRAMKPKEQIVAASLPVVTVESPKLDSIEIFTGLTGSVEPADIVYVIPKMSGEVTDVYVKSGDVVQEGQLLCKIDTKQVDTAKISMDSAALAMQDANNNLSRMQVLFASGDISKQQFEQAQTGAKSAKLQYESAKLNYDNQVEYSSITAPISGLVESFNVEVHDNVSSQNQLCVISGEGTKAVSFYVTERVVNGLKVGDTVRIEKNGSDYEGVITELSSMIDSDTGLFKVKASLDQADALATGSQVKLYVISERADNVSTIPTDAIYYENGEPRVYLYEDGKVLEVPVELGVYDSVKAEVKSGLKDDDQIIVTWSSELFNGAQVQLQSELETGVASSEQETAAVTDAQTEAQEASQEAK